MTCGRALPFTAMGGWDAKASRDLGRVDGIHGQGSSQQNHPCLPGTQDYSTLSTTYAEA